MIATVTFDPCIKLELGLECLSLATANSARRKRMDVSGKGFDLSAALRKSSVPTICLGISFERDNSLIERHLEERCIARDFAVAQGNARRKITLEDSSARESTVIEIPADPIPPHVAEGFLRKLEHYAHHCSKIAFCDYPPDNGYLYQASLALLQSLGVAFSSPDRPFVAGVSKP